jgi:hypothetical protein
MFIVNRKLHLSKELDAPIPVAARSKACVRGRSLAGLAVSNPAGGTDVSYMSVVCYQVEISASS